MSKEYIYHQKLQYLLLTRKYSITFKLVRLPNTTVELYCFVSTGSIYATNTFRKLVFNSMHNLSQHSMRWTSKLIKNKFVWPSIAKDTQTWVRYCLACQRSKIPRPTKSEAKNIPISSERFEHINIDIVGPLPTWKGYMLLPDMCGQIHYMARGYSNDNFDWVTRFGIPLLYTTDHGSQFGSLLFSALSRLLGMKKSTPIIEWPNRKMAPASERIHNMP